MFGAFIAGSMIPANHKIRKIIIGKFQDVSTLFLLPLFFSDSYAADFSTQMES
ncbi:hypothetical protein [Leptospira idonii]|uniref:hypothetical protein n=1 Tax=Leptospira idonii TaxID=1193500 RepID=UPI0014384FD5|nr:hypothetical protein [Leptospira idonii]